MSSAQMERWWPAFAAAAALLAALPGTAASARPSASTRRVSVGPGGEQGNGQSFAGPISAKGRFVAFTSDSSNLGASGDTNGAFDVFVRDLRTGTTREASVDPAGAAGDGDSFVAPPGATSPPNGSISSDGRFVAFDSEASNLVGDDTNGRADVFLRDLRPGTTRRVSVGRLGQGNGDSFGGAVAADGRVVAFESSANNLVSGDTNRSVDVFVRDMHTARTQRISVGSGGAQGNSDSHISAISANGRFVAFDSLASNLVHGDTNRASDVFVRDLRTGRTRRVSVNSRGSQANAGSFSGFLSGDGRIVAFASRASNLVRADTTTGRTSSCGISRPGRHGV